jgi:fatty acyl-CoA reductase
MNPSSFASIFSGETIFLTGATGFIGKFLIEKLLSSCDIKRLIILIRDKKGQTSYERSHEFRDDPLFKIRLSKDRLDKISVISGDVSQEDLGIGEDDLILLKDVTIVIHSAATVKFTEAWKTAVNINISGTKRLLSLSRTLKEVKLFIHFSTMFTTPDRKEMSQRVFEGPISPDALMLISKELSSANLNIVMESIKRSSTDNSYCLTKCVTENLVLQEAEQCHFTTIIIKIPIVMPPLSEPEPLLHGPPLQMTSRVVSMAGNGMVRVIPFGGDNRPPCLPVDLCVNSIILIVGETLRELKSPKVHHGKKVKVYPITSTLGVYSDVCGSSASAGQQNPSAKRVRRPLSFTNRMLGYTGPIMIRSYIIFEIMSFFYDKLFAHFVDFVNTLFGRRSNAASDMNRAIEALKELRFTDGEYQLEGNSVHAIYERLTQADKRLFNVNASDFNWEDYSQKWWYHLKHVVFKENAKMVEEINRHSLLMDFLYYGCYWPLLLSSLATSIYLLLF